MILPDSEVTSLKAALHCWEWFGYISTAVVGLGCIGEFVAEFTSIPTCEQRKREVAKLSLLILILGIAGELLSTVRTSQLSGQLIANIEERAGEAEERAAQLEAQIQPRTLTLEQQRAIANSCRGFAPGMAVTVWSYFLDPEGQRFALQIESALNQLTVDGLTVNDRTVELLTSKGIVKGVQIRGDPLASPLAQAIARSLEGKVKSVSFPDGMISPKPSEVVIIVGVKPFALAE